VAIEVKVPQLPESVADATLVAWHKKAGDSVRRDENLVDLETDKVVLEVPAPSDGTLTEIKINDGTTVTSGQILALIEPADAATVASAAAATSSAPAGGSEPDSEPVSAAEPPAGAGARAGAAAHKLGPAARKLVEEHALDATAIRGSGREGRVTKGDVLSHLAYADRESPQAPDLQQPRERAEQRVPMTRLRARIAERLVEAQQTAAMLTTFNEIDMSAVMELRRSYQEQFVAQHDVKLGFMSFFVRACVEGLRKYPLLNASIDGGDIVYHEYFDIGVAVSTERGLVVPILRDADGLGFAEIERRIADFGQRARNAALGMEELTGGTFTITNGGIFGSLMSTPILNPPQSGILGMHKIQDRPVAVDGRVEIRPMMYVALTYDHRIVDGREAVQFLVTLKEQVEDPMRLMLRV
jgi:2-oxoglutarate dehydrogenase E2 component (dihydrolipoamide succinyltransferase)